jgi:F0F1-type ATP synthase membrane subunit b/b'
VAQDTHRTVDEIEHTRDELARKVDELVDQAKVEATELGKKVAVGAAAVAALVLVGLIAKSRVRS